MLIGLTVIFLTPRHDIGISRNQGVLRFDGKSIVLEPIKREGFPTFLNGVLVDMEHLAVHLGEKSVVFPTHVRARTMDHSVNESQCQHWAQALLDADLVGEGGFSYFVVQEPCFGPRDPLTGELTETGEYRERWPHGMAAFGRFLKERGMKLGIYTDIGDLTCGGCVGSGSGPTGHVAIDMETFARWGADFIEVDACGGPVDEETWREYRDAINATGRPMVHSVCAEGYAEPWTWGNGVGNMWRVNGDIADGWLNIIQGLNGANAIPQLARYASPGGWNDMDMLEIGARAAVKLLLGRAWAHLG